MLSINGCSTLHADLAANALNEEWCHAADKYCCMASCRDFSNDCFQANAGNISLLLFLA